MLFRSTHQPGEYRDRGQYYLKLGHVRAASEDLRRYLSLVPQADDVDAVALQVAEIGTNLPRLN